MYKITPEGIFIKIKIVPNSSKNDIIKEEEFIKVKINAQPIENKANIALIEFLSKNFKIPKTNIDIVKGLTSKEKTLLIKTDSEDKVNKILQVLQIKEEGIK